MAGNPYHRGSGPQGGQFTSRAEAGTGAAEGAAAADLQASQRAAAAVLTRSNYRGIDYVSLTRSGNQAVAQHNQATLDRALAADRNGYAKGLKTLDFESGDWWFRSAYVKSIDQIWMSNRFINEQEQARVIDLLHEFGHRGSETAGKDAFADFQKRGLDKFFPDIVSTVQAARYGRDQWATEAFAQSYALYNLKVSMPAPLQQFWAAHIASPAVAGGGGETTGAGE